MNDKRKEKLKKNLVAGGLMNKEDILIECIQANYVEPLIGKIGEWKQGWVYFTQERFLCPTGLLDEDIVIPYQNIRKIEKFSKGFIPMGMMITYEHPKTGELTTNKFLISKREKWISFLTKKAGI